MERRQFLGLVGAAGLGVVGLSACGGGGGSTETTTGGSAATTAAKKKVKVGLVYDIGGRGDKSFNDAAAAGLDKAKAELGVDIHDVEPDKGGENREKLLRDMADQNYNLIIGVGFAFEAAMGKVAKDYKDAKDLYFAIVDAKVDAPNVASLVFAEEEGSFLVGAAAALKSKSKKVGFVGGVENALIKRFETGFTKGVAKADPSVKVEVKYITQEPDFSGFKDPAKGKVITEGLYSSGCDIVYHAAGGSGNGVFQAAVAANKLAIGVDSDQYLSAPPDQQKVILTSMLKRVDVAVFDTIKKATTGSLKGGVSEYDLKNDGVGYSTSGGKVDDIKAKLDELKKGIVEGSISLK